MHHHRAISCLIAASLSACTCGATRPPDTPDVVVILVDTLRADALGDETPAIAEFARSGTSFTEVLAPAAWTIPSVASLMTGLAPETHRVLRFRGEERVALDVLGSSLTTLAERLHDAGYETTALLKSPVIAETHGFAQGFDRFEHVPGETASGSSARELTDAAIATLEAKSSAARLLWLHYMDPHTPYQPPARLAEASTAGIESAFNGSHEEIVAFKAGRAQPSRADLEKVRALYQAEVIYLDHELRRLFHAIERQPHPTLVILIADHGEQLGEHGGWLHEHVWRENLHVPFIVAGAGVKADHRVDTPVSSMSLTPTVLDWLGLDPIVEAQGPSLARALRGAAIDAQPIASSYGTLHAIRDGAHKLIVDRAATGSNTPYLYDLVADPHEHNDIAANEPAQVARLQAMLDRATDTARTTGQALQGRVDVAALPSEQRAALKTLGYVE